MESKALTTTEGLSCTAVKGIFHNTTKNATVAATSHQESKAPPDYLQHPKLSWEISLMIMLQWLTNESLKANTHLKWPERNSRWFYSPMPSKTFALYDYKHTLRLLIFDPSTDCQVRVNCSWLTLLRHGWTWETFTITHLLLPNHALW